jgi:uncharacterized protein
MKFTLQKLKTESPFHFEGNVDVSDLEEMNNDIRKIDPVHVKGVATIQGEHITFQFDIRGTMVLPCARTLADVDYPFHISCVEVFSTSPHHSEKDDEIHEIHGEILDLTPYIKENILLEVPLQVFASNMNEDAQFQNAGFGWQFLDEEKEEQKVDPRLEKLSQFFQKDNSEK